LPFDTPEECWDDSARLLRLLPARSVVHHIRPWVFFLLLFTSRITAVCQQLAPNAGNATVPPLVKFSGVLIDGSGKPISGSFGVTPSLYKDEQGGSPLWLETQSVQLDKSGHYSVMLGSTTSQGLPGDLCISGEAHWLGVQPQGQAEEPRVMLLSVPCAEGRGRTNHRGLPPAAFALAAPNGVSAASASSLAANSGSAGAPPVGGSGTVNYVPIWTDSTGDLGNSVLFQSGSGSKAKLGINATKPTC
jgi:hypothetical protein